MGMKQKSRSRPCREVAIPVFAERNVRIALDAPAVPPKKVYRDGRSAQLQMELVSGALIPSSVEKRPGGSLAEKPFAERMERVSDWLENNGDDFPELWIAPQCCDGHFEMNRLSRGIQQTGLEALYVASQLISSCEVGDGFSERYNFAQEESLYYEPVHDLISHGGARNKPSVLDREEKANEISSSTKTVRSGEDIVGSQGGPSTGDAASDAGQGLNRDSVNDDLAINETLDGNVDSTSREGPASSNVSSWETITSEPTSNDDPGSKSNRGSDDEWESYEGSTSGKDSASGKNSSSDKDSVSNKDPTEEAVGPAEDSGQPTPAMHNEVGWIPHGQKHIHWRPGDDIIPCTANDYEAIPNFTKSFDEQEETTLSEIRSRQHSTFPRLKAKTRSVFDKSSLETYINKAPVIEPNNRQGRAREKAAFAVPAEDSVHALMERRKQLTGRKIKLGSGELFWFPMTERANTLYYLIDPGDGSLEMTINDIGDLSVDKYDEYKEDILLMQWLIDIEAYQQWSFSVDSFCCRECLSARNIMQKRAWFGERYEHGGRRYKRIPCPHKTKISRFFEALGETHTTKLTKINLLVNVDNCLNPETIASAVHVITTTFERITAATVVFHSSMGQVSPKTMRPKLRSSIVRSLRQLETWIGAGNGLLRVTGLDNHRQIFTDLNQARRKWFYDLGPARRVRRRTKITIAPVNPAAQ